MNLFVVLSSLLTALLLPGCTTRRCAPGEFPNDYLQACVVLPACDGGIVNERNECVLMEATTAATDGGKESTGAENRGADAGDTRGSTGAGRNAAPAGVGGGGARTAAGAGATAGAGAAAGAGAQGGAGAAGGMPSDSPRCGDHHLDPNEKCDGNCPTQCTPASSCVQAVLVGAAAQCTAECMSTPITACASGDGCCAMGCTHATDTDCSAKCGDGVVDTGEKCEATSKTKPCPTSCADTDPCTADMLVGASSSCSAECVHMPITAAVGGDECCAPGANANSDSDCMPKCGNGAVEGSETCDGDCPTSCGGAGCMPQKLVGSASQCSAECVPMTITTAVDGDGCCPEVANANSDSDCMPKCGNGAREAGEKCDGDCPTSCPPSSGCSGLTLKGASSTCDAECGAVTITMAVNGDGCCPAGQSSTTDSDCKPSGRYTACGFAGDTCDVAHGFTCTSLNVCSTGACKISNDCPLEPPLTIVCSKGTCLAACSSDTDCPSRTECREHVCLSRLSQ